VQHKRASEEDRLVPVLMHPMHRPMYVAIKTAALLCFLGISSTVASVIPPRVGGQEP
jgi:hypothetical protein